MKLKTDPNQFLYDPSPVNPREIKTLGMNFWQRFKLRYERDLVFSRNVDAWLLFGSSLAIAVIGVTCCFLFLLKMVE